MHQDNKHRIGRSAAFPLAGITAFCIAVALFICNLIRIIRIPITCDEAPSRSDLLMSYGDFAHLNKVTANIHILNSILRKASTDIFGNTPFFLRLPSLLAQALFMWFCYRLACRLFKEGGWRIAVFLACNLNPLMFEFWAYSRGYSLAIAFMTVSIYYLVVYLQEEKPWQICLALVSAMAAVWSNFALLNFCLALAGALAMHGILRERRAAFFRTVLPMLLTASALLALLIYAPIKKLRASNELYYGGERGLVSDTITSLVKESMYIVDQERLLVKAPTYLLLVLLCISIAYQSIRFMRDPGDTRSRIGMSLSLLLLIPLASIVVQYHLLGTKYLIDRTAMFLILLIVIHISHFLYSLRPGMPIASRIAMFGLTALFGWNFFLNINFKCARMWWYDKHNVKVLELLSRKPSVPGRPIRLRVCWLQMPSIDYYIHTRYDSLFYPLEYIKDAPGPADTSYDYVYLPVIDAGNLSGKYVVDTAFDEEFSLYRKR
jgi:hypothetical protein